MNATERDLELALGREPTQADKDKVIELCLGRLFRLGSRPTQPGDVEEYERIRTMVMDLADPVTLPYTPNYARDRKGGAQGD